MFGLYALFCVRLVRLIHCKVIESKVGERSDRKRLKISVKRVITVAPLEIQRLIKAKNAITYFLNFYLVALYSTMGSRQSNKNKAF